MATQKKPVYVYQCIICGKKMYTRSTTLKHCGRLTQWVEGIEGKGVNMESRKVKVLVSGYIEVREEELDKILAYDDPHRGLVFSIPMGYVDASNLEFTDTRK